MKKNKTVQHKLLTPIIVLLLTVIIFVVFFILRDKPDVDNRDTALAPTITNIISTPTLPAEEPKLKYTQRKLVGEESGNNVRYQSSKLGIEFILPNIKELTSLTEKIDVEPSDPEFKEIALGYCVTTDTDHFDFQTCPASDFAISSYTKGTGLGREGGFWDLTSFFNNSSGLYARWSLIEGKITDEKNNDTKLIRNKYKVDILSVTGKSKLSEITNQEFDLPGTPGEGYLGAIVNLPNNSIYSGFNIRMKLSDTLTKKVFDEILNSIKIVK